MVFTQSNSRLNSDILRDGEYYVFSKQEGEKIQLGYVYTTWCGSPCGTHMIFSLVELRKPLPLVGFGRNQYDKGQLKTFSFDSRNLDLIDDVYNRATGWLKKMQSELKYPQLDESRDCMTAIIVVKKGVLSGLYEKNNYFIKCSQLSSC